MPTSGPDIVRNPTAAAEFQPTGYINVPGLADVAFQSYSFVTWFQLDELAPANMLITKGSSGPGVSSIWLFVAGDELVGEHEPDGMHAEQVRIGGVEAGRWYGAVFTYDAAEKEMKLYLAACGL